VLSVQKILNFFFLKKEITNFDHADDVLLVWVITGTGRCEGSYSHTNSMLFAYLGQTIPQDIPLIGLGKASVLTEWKVANRVGWN
jgi:hypothetical protein